MTYTIHRGANEIGVSCVEICSATTRIVIDIGMPLMNPDGSGFDSSNIKTQSAEKLLDNKVLPAVPGLSKEGDKKKTALLISHAHQDHYGLIDYVNKKIPVYFGKASHALIELTAVFAGKDKVIENPRYFESYKAFTIGDMEITPYLMDHAAFDAYAFLVRCEDETLLYTGDFRAHGRKWKLFYKFLHIIPKKIDWLLMEGTSLSRKKQRFKTEEQLENEFVKTFKETRGLYLVYLSGQNIDRLVTIFLACKRSEKLFVIDFYIATVLSELAALGYGVPYPSPGFSEIRVFFPNLLRRKMEKLNRKELIDKFEKKSLQGI
jgi:ribonuclease J